MLNWFTALYTCPEVYVPTSPEHEETLHPMIVHRIIIFHLTLGL